MVPDSTVLAVIDAARKPRQGNGSVRTRGMDVD
jgi:hypothetical protein